MFTITRYKNLAGFLLGIFLFGSIILLPPPEGLSAEGWHTTAVALLMATWWILEVIPIAVTALLPVVLFPVMNITAIKPTLAPYAHPLIFLFMGGFIIALAMEKWDLHRRIALNIINAIGTKPNQIVLGFIAASAFLSMWVSNTATALMMLPIATSVLTLVDKKLPDRSERRNFGLSLLLAVAFGCNIGGMGTLIGTPPNALLAAYMEDNYGHEISFLRWLLFGFPLVLISLPVLYIVLTKFVYPLRVTKLPGGKSLLKEKMKTLDKITIPEKKVAGVFIATALLWISRPIIENVISGITDTGIAIAAAVSLFLIPAKDDFILSWPDMKRLPWGVLILFGGGLSLASAISTTGLAEWLGESVAILSNWPVFLVLLLVVALVVFLTEITSNTATAAAFLPVMGSIAAGLGQHALLFTLPVALAASSAFMLPVATPPNAIIYSSNRIDIPEMVRAGIWLNLIFIVLIGVVVYYFAPILML